MGSKRFELGLCFVVFMGFLSMSHSYNFRVGGKDGWVLNPSEGYNHWAERNRFQVNDTLDFGNKKGTDSVLVVTKEDYFSCNIKNPIKSLTEGNSFFVFDRSGPFFFIAGNKDNCVKGQKLVVVVMAVRNKTHHHHYHPELPSPAPSPSASLSSPSPAVVAPNSPSPSPAELPVPSVQQPARSPGATPSDMYGPALAPAHAGKNSGSVVGPFGFVSGIIMSFVLGSFVV